MAQAAAIDEMINEAIETVTHPATDAFIEAHGAVIMHTPNGVPDFVETWAALVERFADMSRHPGEMGDRLHREYPIAAAMQGYLDDYGQSYLGMAEGAQEVLTGYMTVQEHDVARHYEPRVNEKWANVTAEGNNAEPIGPGLVEALDEAHRLMFGYEPENPLDLELFFRSFPQMFDRMADQVDAGRSLVAGFFPGAQEIPDSYYNALKDAYNQARDESHMITRGYRTVSAEDLMRHKHARTNEQLADVSA